MKPFDCKLCDTKFRSKSGLWYHISSIHEEKRLVKCNLCDNKLEKSGLKKHIAIVHEGKKPFKCNICGGFFSEKSTLSYHSSDVHERKKSYECIICEGKFARKDSLKKHIVFKVFNLLAVIIEVTNLPQRDAWIGIWHLFMEEKELSNATYVIPCL